jgi:hypothetical protein
MLVLQQCVSKKLKREYNITDDCTCLYDASNTWMEALKRRNLLGILFIHTLKGTSYIDFLGPCINSPISLHDLLILH